MNEVQQKIQRILGSCPSFNEFVNAVTALLEEVDGAKEAALRRALDLEKDLKVRIKELNRSDRKTTAFMHMLDEGFNPGHECDCHRHDGPCSECYYESVMRERGKKIMDAP